MSLRDNQARNRYSAAAGYEKTMIELAAAGLFESRIVPRLRAMVHRIRLYVFADGLADTSAVLLLCFCAQISIDYLFHLRVDLRATLLLTVMAVIGFAVWKRLIQPLMADLDVADAAMIVERKFPQLESRLISALQFSALSTQHSALSPATGEASGFRLQATGTSPEARSPKPGAFRPAAAGSDLSPELVDRLIEEASRMARELPMDAVLNHQRVRRQSAVVCGVLAVLVGFTLFAPEAMGTWFERNILLGDTAWKQNTYLVVLNDEDQDGVIYAPRGDDLVVRVQSRGRRPRQVEMDLHFESGQSESHSLTAVGRDEFRFTIPRLNEALTLRVRGGDARNDAVQVRVVDRPGLADVAVTVSPPAYTREPPRELQAGRSLIEILYGSEVEIRFRSSKLLRQAVLLRDLAEERELAGEEDAYVARFTPDRNATYSFALTDVDGLTNTRPRQFLVRMVPDAPPTASLTILGVGDLITPLAELRLELSFKDRYGLQAAELLHEIKAEEVNKGSIPIEDVSPGSTQVTTTMQLAVSTLGVLEGQQLVLQARAQDQNGVTGPGVGESARYTLRVVSAEALLAELSRREQEYRQEFERLIDIQEKLRQDTLSAAAIFGRDGASRPGAINFATLERRQRQIARQVGHVGEQFRRIHQELVINQLNSAQVEKRLVDDIVTPLDSLASRAITDLAELVDHISGDPSSTAFREIDRRQDQVVVEMRRIAANMTKWEGFHETITLLQTIIRMQKQLQEETDETLNRQLDDIFEEN